MTTVMRFSFFSTIDKITALLFLLNQLVSSCFFFFSCDSPIFKIKFLKKNEQLWCITISQINRIFRIFLLGSSPSLARTISGADLNDWGFYDVFFHSISLGALSVPVVWLLLSRMTLLLLLLVSYRARPFDMRALLLLLVGKQSRPRRRRDDSARTFATQLYVPLDLLEYKPGGGHTCLLLL